LGRWITIVGIAISVTAWAQESRTRFVIGVSVLGPNTSCENGPVFISSVTPKSPAESAGLQPGDQLLAVNGNTIHDARDASKRIASTVPDPILLTIQRSQSVKTVSVARESRESLWSDIGLRSLEDGSLVGTDYTDAEIAETLRLHTEIDQVASQKDFVNVFPGHYPADKSLYYPGFELFVWDHGQQVHVGGIEDGPAKEKGVRWGDHIISVNGEDPRGISVGELEALFSSPNPSTMKLVVVRAGIQKSFTLPLARAAGVLAANHWRIADGKMVPDWVPEKLTSCFE
jgi:C-terminal processing protease CtpA/Prc